MVLGFDVIKIPAWKKYCKLENLESNRVETVEIWGKGPEANDVIPLRVPRNECCCFGALDGWKKPLEEKESDVPSRKKR